MATPCFYYPELDQEGVVAALSTAESAHALQSRRLKTGSLVNLINGQGLKAKARIVETAKRGVLVHVETVQRFAKPSSELTIAVAMPKGDRQKTMVDILTQQGVTKIIPLVSQYTVSNLKDSQIQKLQRLVIESCKQSQNPWLTEISHPSSIDAILELNASKYFASQGGDDFYKYRSKVGQVIVFIGPEGGFSESEVSGFERNDVQGIALGEHILRTEAAAVSVAALFMS